jgi:hypothetical protein
VRFATSAFVAVLTWVLGAGDTRALTSDGYTWHAVPAYADQVALYKGDKQLGNYLYSKRAYYGYDEVKQNFEEKPTPCPVAPPLETAHESSDALAEVNAARAARGLRPFTYDEGLTKAALGASRFRAANLVAGHTGNDFAYLPAGSQASAAGCAAWHDSWGWGSCCTYEGFTYAGAAWVRGSDNRRYMHLFVR